MANKDFCQYKPCHKILEDCDFCYCLIYPCNIVATGGRFIMDKKTKKRIWDCSKCTVVHTKEFVSILRESFRTIVHKLIRRDS